MSRHAAPVLPQDRLRWWVTAAVLLLTATASVTVGVLGRSVALADRAATTVQAGGVVLPGSVALQPLPEGPPVVGPTLPAGSVGELAVPVSLRIPVIGVDTSLGQLGLNPDRTVQVPTDFDQPGWFGLGPAPGQLGSAVILGHVDSYQGPAVFFRLGDLHPGDQVEVALTDHTVAQFRVTTVATYPKEQFPAQLVYAPQGGSALNLVTCGGVFDTHTRSYLSNVVVTTTLTALTTNP